MLKFFILLTLAILVSSCSSNQVRPDLSTEQGCEDARWEAIQACEDERSSMGDNPNLGTGNVNFLSPEVMLKSCEEQIVIPGCE